MPTNKLGQKRSRQALWQSFLVTSSSDVFAGDFKFFSVMTAHITQPSQKVKDSQVIKNLSQRL